jgi:hypothetical protein
LEDKNSGSGLESLEYGLRDASANHVAPFIQKTLALTLPTSGGHSLFIVCSRTQATELSLIFYTKYILYEILQKVLHTHYTNTSKAYFFVIENTSVV